MFTFLSPSFLVGLLAAAIPLIVHLSRSRRQRKMQFSTTRFFTDQFLRSYRMSKLKEIWLLIARMALFGLLAMALARPILMPPGGRALFTGKRAVVLVLDNSASMGYTDPDSGLSLFDRARAAAHDVLDTLGPGDTASVVLAARRSAGPEVLFPEPTAALGDVRQVIDSLTVADLGTDLATAVRRAETVAQTGPAQSREVYLLSDLQDSGWEITDDLAAGQDDAGSDVLFFFVSVRPDEPRNLAITSLQYVNARPMAGIPFAFRPLVLNQGAEVRGAEVALVIDDRKVAQQRVDKIQPGRWAVPWFHHAFDTPGWHTGYVEVTDPGLAADNRRYFAFEVMESIPVLAVNGAPSQVAQQDELYFLRTALTVAPDGGTPIRLETVDPASLGPALETGVAPLVIMANVASLPADTVQHLETFVDQGGSLLVFLGDRCDPRFYNQQLAAPSRLHGGLVPAQLDQIAGDPGSDDAYTRIAMVDREHPALTVFHEPRFASLAGVRYQALWAVTVTDGTVLMRAATGEPLLIEKPFGNGRVLVSTVPADRDWSNFPVRPAYLPWVHRLVAYLAQRPLGRVPFHATGQAVPLTVSATTGMEPVLVTQPDGTRVPATPSGDAATPLVFTDTTQIGVYEVAATEAAARQLFVANLEGYESDLTYLDDVLAVDDTVEAGFSELMGGRPLVNFVADAATVADASLTARRGIKLWDIFLVIVLVIALVEPWAANRISLRHYAGKDSKPD